MPNQDFTPTEGETIGDRYVVQQVIGRGGMGVVYAGFDNKLERSVAVKFLDQSLSGDREVSSRFQREALAAGRIGHENICDVRDLGNTEDGTPYIVMELLEGQPLSARLELVGRLPPREAVDIALQVLAALEAAHAAGIIHRDLKPENVFLAEHSSGLQRVKIVDFGISKVMNDSGDLRLTETGVVVGSPYYMSPEQARGRDVDGRTDLWGVGVILYELLTGALPFNGENYNDVMIRIVTEQPAPPKELDPSLPRPLERVVLQALKKNRNERFGSAGEFIAALEEIRDSLADVALPVEPQPRRRARSKMVAAIAGGAVVLLVSAVVGGFLIAGVGSGGPSASASAASTAPSDDGAVPAEAGPPLVAVRIAGLPEGATLNFDGQEVAGDRIEGPEGHRGQLVLERPDRPPLRVELTLTDGQVLDLTDRLAPPRALDGGTDAAAVDGGAAPAAHRRPPRSIKRTRPGRFLQGRERTKIILDYGDG